MQYKISINYSLTFYTFEQHWQIKAALLPSTNIWGSSSVVHSTAHWWLRSSHFLCVDPACHSLKCCSCHLWSLKGTYRDHTIQIFQMQWIMQKGRWSHGPRVSSLCLVFSLAMLRVCIDSNSTARQIKRGPLSAVEQFKALFVVRDYLKKWSNDAAAHTQ